MLLVRKGEPALLAAYRTVWAMWGVAVIVALSTLQDCLIVERPSRAALFLEGIWGRILVVALVAVVIPAVVERLLVHRYHSARG